LNKINSFDELKSIQNRYNTLLELRKINEELEQASEGNRCSRYLSICGGTGCKSAKSDEILANLQSEIAAAVPPQIDK